MVSSSKLDQWLQAIEAMHPQSIAMGLERSRIVADRLGLGSHLGLDVPVITVGGTNGKGSTCAMLESICSRRGTASVSTSSRTSCASTSARA